MNPDTEKTEDAKKKTFVEEMEVAGEELVKRVKELAADSRTKRVRIIEPDGDVALEIPLHYGAIAGGAVVLAAPALALVGTLAALVARVKLEIVKEAEPETEEAP